MKTLRHSLKTIILLLFVSANVFSANDSLIQKNCEIDHTDHYLQLSRMKNRLNAVEIELLYDDNYSLLLSKLENYDEDVANINAYFKDEKQKYYSYRLLKSLYSYVDEKGKDLAKLKKSVVEKNSNAFKFSEELNAFQVKLRCDTIKCFSGNLNSAREDVVFHLNKLVIKCSNNILQYDALERSLLSLEIDLLSIKENIRIRLRNYNKNFFSEGRTYKDTIQTLSIFESLSQSSKLSDRILRSYIQERYMSFIVMFIVLLIGLIIHYRISGNKKIPDAVINSYAVLNKKNNLSVFYVLFLLSVIIPYLFSNTPILLVEIFMTISGLILTVLVFKSNTVFRKFKYAWASFFIIFRLIAVINVVVFSYKYETVIWLIINIISVVIGTAFILLSRGNSDVRINKKIRILFSSFISFTLLAIIANIAKCHTLSRLLTVGSLFSIYSIVIFYFFNNYFKVFINYYIDSLRSKLPVYFENEIKGLNILFVWGIKLFSIASALLICIHSFSLDYMLLGKIDTLLNFNFTAGTYSFTILGVLLVLFILIATFTITRLIGFYLDYYSNIRIHKNFSYKLLVKLVIYFGGFYLIISLLGLSSNNLSVLIGALGFGIGFGLQSIIANFTAGLMLILEGRVKIDDFIEISDKNGTVKEINGRSVRLYTQDGSDILVPNTEFLNKNMKNWSLSNSIRRLEINLNLDFSNDITLVKSVLTELVSRYDITEIIEKTKVNILSLDEGCVKMVCYVWVRNHVNMQEIRSEIIESIEAKFRELNIKFKQ